MASDEKPKPLPVEYDIWYKMRIRCRSDKNYHGRGIRVCERWADSFENFYQDMGQRPSPKHSIDRINNDGNYEPDNCRWATKLQQARNKRNTIYLEINGVTRPLSEWAKMAGLNYNALNRRLANGWNKEDLFRPIGYRSYNKTKITSLVFQLIEH